jgi:hypothetical protein
MVWLMAPGDSIKVSDYKRSDGHDSSQHCFRLTNRLKGLGQITCWKMPPSCCGTTRPLQRGGVCRFISHFTEIMAYQDGIYDIWQGSLISYPHPPFRVFQYQTDPAQPSLVAGRMRYLAAYPVICGLGRPQEPVAELIWASRGRQKHMLQLPQCQHPL